MPELSRGNFVRGGAAALLCAMTGDLDAAEEAASFYRGREITLIVPTVRGGINDLACRLVARHLSRFVPGGPSIRVENRDRGGGLALANRFADPPPAERDGATIAILQRGIAQLAVQGDPYAKFDPLRLNWLGSLSSFASDAYVLLVASRHPARTVAELKPPAAPALIGGDAPGSTNLTFALVARDALKLNIAVKDGFAGAAGLFFAMAQGDLDGQVVGLNSIRANQTALWNAGEFRPLLQFGRKNRHPDLQGVPLASEIAADKAVLDIVAFTEAPLMMALPFLAPSGIPEVRASALKSAFIAMTSDYGFLADAARVKLDITSIDSDAVRAVIADMAATPKDVVERHTRIVNAI